MWGEASPAQALAADMLRSYFDMHPDGQGLGGFALHDPLAVGIATDPSWVRLDRGKVFVEAENEITRGQSTFFPQGHERMEGKRDRGEGFVALEKADKNFADHFASVIAQM